MLPDYPKTKDSIRDRFLLRPATQAMKKYGLDIPAIPINEGHRHILIRADGTREETKMKEHGAEIAITQDQAQETTLSQIIEMGRNMGDKIGRQLLATITEEFHRVTQMTGNVVRARGQICPNTILELLRAIDIDFDEDGHPNLPSAVMGAGAYPQFVAAAREFENSPELQKLFREILDEKREEHREREAARKLVD